MPEYEVRLFAADETLLQIVVVDAAGEKAALAKAATLAKEKGAAFFDIRRPTSQRWVRRY
jgi:hypothetical protein